MLFDGDVTTDEDRAKIPAEIRQRLKLVESNTFTIRGMCHLLNVIKRPKQLNHAALGRP